MKITRRSVLAGRAAAFAAESVVRLPKKSRLVMHGFEGHNAEILDPLPQLPDVELVAFSGNPADLNRPSNNKYLNAARKDPSYTEMLEREKPDVVAICNNDADRAGAILEATRRKMHVIAEKPLAISRSDFNNVRSS